MISRKTKSIIVIGNAVMLGGIRAHEMTNLLLAKVLWILLAELAIERYMNKNSTPWDSVN